ncbi:TIGR02281 family clan AA aspartic protease [Sphingomonas sinipercae]|uniref:TIGR02281 family clan AA aspartic protease n=1 Tax=Sphingomonas sinipercae TaxID=2714944 RepID=A0A6G7ZMM4_9SPHN|nr:TIGR02281 family clan AA aspartic protease [Sphingomonas sinipercae]QIL02234.1 TIGR02281 family clan AA aspartic protease [Sphingomonas sinipercae]
MTADPQLQQLLVYAVIGAVLIMLLSRLPYVGRAVRFLFSFGLIVFALFLLFQQAPYQPTLARITERLGLDGQQVAGEELRVRMSADGHFWARATVNGVPTRMLIDSGATVTAVSTKTAHAAGIDAKSGLAPIVLRTANGVAPARTGSVDELRIGNIVARDLKIVSAPGLGDMDVLGMNFLSELESWRVEGRTLILVPHHPQPVA